MPLFAIFNSQKLADDEISDRGEAPVPRRRRRHPHRRRPPHLRLPPRRRPLPPILLISAFLRAGALLISVDGQSRHRLSLDAHALVDAVPAIFDRFDSVTKLALKCDLRSDSISDDALEVISRRCPKLTRLKLRACKGITFIGMAVLALNCRSLRKFSCGSCTSRVKGVDAVLRGCPLLEEILIKSARIILKHN